VSPVSSEREKVLRRKIFALSLLVLAAILFLSHGYIIKGIGRYLVLNQAPREAAVIVVLNGRDTERALAAVDLYNQGYAKLMVLARGPKQPGSDEFWERVGKDWNSKIFFQRAVEAMGVPPSAFKLIGDGVTSTYDEANVTRKFLEKNGYKSILLVTSKWHSKRAYLTFKSALKKDGILVTVTASKYDTFDPDTWWKSQVNTETVFGEYLRLAYYLLTSRIRLFH
jgi:uncharacterized SAM-binding protein YcdF (DUF218 family)